jgi:hypothetical protein
MTDGRLAVWKRKTGKKRANLQPSAYLFQVVLPGLVAGLAGAGNGIGASERLTGVEVGRLDEAADAEFATGGADDCHAADDQRRNGENLAVCRIGDLSLPIRPRRSPC